MSDDEGQKDEIKKKELSIKSLLIYNIHMNIV